VWKHIEQSELAPPLTVEVENNIPTVNAGNDLDAKLGDEVTIVAKAQDTDKDPLKYTWELVSQPDGANTRIDGAGTPTVKFTPTKPGQYMFDVKVDDGRGGIAMDDVTVNVTKKNGQLTFEGMHPAAVFNVGIGMSLKAKQDNKLAYLLEAGPLFGNMERIDNDTIEIRDPMDGSLLTTIELEKVLKNDVSGFYANAFARIGDKTMVSLNVRQMKQDGHFSIDGENVSSYERENLEVSLRLMRGARLIDNLVIAGDLALIYNSIKDKAEDDFGEQSSDADMIGGGGRIGAGLQLNINDFTYVPGLGIAGNYLSGEGDDVRTVLMTRAGVYDMTLGDYIALSLEHIYNQENQSISEKELDSILTTHGIGAEVSLNLNRLRIGLEAQAILSGKYKESFPGDVEDVDGDVSGFGVGLGFKIPVKRYGDIGINGRYKARTINLDNGGEETENIGSVGVSFEW